MTFESGPAPLVTETCSCGAKCVITTATVTMAAARSTLVDFREAHAVCRAAVSVAPALDHEEGTT